MRALGDPMQQFSDFPKLAEMQILLMIGTNTYFRTFYNLMQHLLFIVLLYNYRLMHKLLDGTIINQENNNFMKFLIGFYFLVFIFHGKLK